MGKERTGRKRRLRRGVLFAALALIVTTAILTIRLFAGFGPQSIVDYAARSNEVSLGAQPDGANSWPAYEEALRQFDQIRTDDSKLIGYLRHGDWSDPRHKAAKDAFDHVSGLIPIIHEATKLPGFFVPLPSQADTPLIVSRLELVDLNGIKQFANLLAVDMRRAANEAQWDMVESNAEALLAMAGQLELQGDVISTLVACSIVHLSASELLFTSLEYDVPPDALRSFAAIPADFKGVDARHILAISRLEALDYAQYMYSGSSWRLMAANLSHAGQIGSHAQAVEIVKEAYRQMEEWWRLPFTQRPIDSGAVQIMDKEPILSFGESPLESLERFRFLLDHLKTQTRGAATALLVQAHFAEHGSWPETLADAMTSEELTDPVSGAPFDYARTPDANGWPFTLDWPKPWAGLSTELLLPQRDEISEPPDDDYRPPEGHPSEARE